MRYAVILTLGTVAICGYLLFLASPRYELGELRAENRELRERIMDMERNQVSEFQTIILIGGGLALGLCFTLCFLMFTECNLRKAERLSYLKFQEMQAMKLIFQNQAMIPDTQHRIEYQEV